MGKVNTHQPMIRSESRAMGTPWRARRLANLRAPAAATWDPLLVAIAIMVLMYVWRLQQLYLVLRIVPVTQLATLVALALWAIDTDPRRTLAGTLKSRVMRLVLALAGVTMLSVPGGVYPTHSWLFLRGEYASTLLFLILVAASIRTVRDVVRLVLVHLMGALVYSVWVLTHSDGGRLGGPYYDPNDLALLLVGALPFALFFLRQRQALVGRLVSLSFLIFLVVLILQTGSRGGFLALVAVMLYVLVRFRAIPLKIRVVAAVAGVGTMLLLGSDEYWGRMQTLAHPTQDYNWAGNSSAGRVEIWKRGMGYMVSSPFGVGVRQFHVAEGFSEESLRSQEAGVGFKWSQAHSSFVQIGAELGILGLATFVLLFANAIKTMASLPPPSDSTSRDEEAAPACGQALAGSLVAFVVAGSFLTHGYSEYLYFVLGMVIGMQKLASKAPNSASLRSRRISMKGYGSRASSG